MKSVRNVESRCDPPAEDVKDLGRSAPPGSEAAGLGVCVWAFPNSKQSAAGCPVLGKEKWLSLLAEARTEAHRLKHTCSSSRDDFMFSPHRRK